VNYFQSQGDFRKPFQFSGQSYKTNEINPILTLV
jgi:hypothetical protein